MIEFFFSKFNIVFSQDVSECQGTTSSIAALVQCLESRNFVVKVTDTIPK